MNFLFIVLLICFFAFLYVLYYKAKDDFVIARKDIAIDKIFNLAFLTGVASLFFARLFYVFFNPSIDFLNPLIFLAFPYVPGLSLFGAIIGGSLFLYVYAGYRKLPFGKMFDLFTISFVSVLPIGYLINFLFLLGKTDLFYNLIAFSSFIIFILFAKIIYAFSEKGEISDGSISLMYISVFSFAYFIIKLFLNIKTFSFLDLENIVILLSIFIPLILLINQEIINKFLVKK